MSDVSTDLIPSYIRAFMRALTVPFAALILCAASVHAQARDPQNRTDEFADRAATEAYSEAELKQLAAPVALYPDPLLSQIFMAATYPLEVVQAACWVKLNSDLEGQARKDALDEQPWAPSVKSLAAVPEVLAMMNDNLTWMERLGEAVLASENDLLEAVQDLRARAYEQGALKATEQLDVTRKTVARTRGRTRTVYVIESADPELVYVPRYDPQVTYGDWPYADYPPYGWYPPDRTGDRVLSFAAGVAAGAALWAAFDWDRGDVQIDVDRYNRYYGADVSDPRWKHDLEHRHRFERPYEGEVAPARERPALRPRERPGREPVPGRRPEAEEPAQRPEGELRREETPAARPPGERFEGEAEPKPAERPEAPAERPEAEEPAGRPDGAPVPREAPEAEPRPDGQPEAEQPPERPEGEPAPAERPEADQPEAEQPKARPEDERQPAERPEADAPGKRPEGEPRREKQPEADQPKARPEDERLPAVRPEADAPPDRPGGEPGRGPEAAAPGDRPEGQARPGQPEIKAPGARREGAPGPAQRPDAVEADQPPAGKPRPKEQPEAEQPPDGPEGEPDSGERPEAEQRGDEGR